MVHRKTRFIEKLDSPKFWISRGARFIPRPKLSIHRKYRLIEINPFTESKTCFDFPIAKSPEVQLLSNHMVNIKDYFQPNQELLNLSNLLAHLVKLLSNFLCFWFIYQPEVTTGHRSSDRKSRKRWPEVLESILRWSIRSDSHSPSSFGK